jgi:hypothetical protein
MRRLLREVLRKRDRHRTCTKFRLGVITWVYELFKRSTLLRHPKKGSFKTTVTKTLTTVRGIKIKPLLRYPTTTTWYNSHRLSLHNSGALPPVHEPFKRPSLLIISEYRHGTNLIFRPTGRSLLIPGIVWLPAVIRIAASWIQRRPLCPSYTLPDWLYEIVLSPVVSTSRVSECGVWLCGNR